MGNTLENWIIFVIFPTLIYVKTYIKKSRHFLLIAGLVVFLCTPFDAVHADLDKNFRENFSIITQKQCFNSIEYSIDNSAGFEAQNTEDKDNIWKCTGGKCDEYMTTVNCLFDNAFEETVNQTNRAVSDYANQEIKGLRTTDFGSTQACDRAKLNNIQEQQESLGFVSGCDENALNKIIPRVA